MTLCYKSGHDICSTFFHPSTHSFIPSASHHCGHNPRKWNWKHRGLKPSLKLSPSLPKPSSELCQAGQWFLWDHGPSNEYQFEGFLFKEISGLADFWSLTQCPGFPWYPRETLKKKTKRGKLRQAQRPGVSAFRNSRETATRERYAVAESSSKSVKGLRRVCLWTRSAKEAGCSQHPRHKFIGSRMEVDSGWPFIGQEVSLCDLCEETSLSGS